MPKRVDGEVSQSEAARRLGLTVQAIGQWTAKPGAPVRRDGNSVFVRWPDFARWREGEMKNTGRNAARAAADNPNSPLSRKLLAEAVTAEHQERLTGIELAKALEQTISLDDHSATIGRILDRLAARLRAMPFAFTHLGEEVERAVEEEAERVITELHHFDEDIIEIEDDDDEDEDAAEDEAA